MKLRLWVRPNVIVPGEYVITDGPERWVNGIVTFCPDSGEGNLIGEVSQRFRIDITELSDEDQS